MIETLENTQTRTRRFSLSVSDGVVAVLLILTMLTGGFFRFQGQSWDDFIRFHPDERYLAGVAASLGGTLTINQSAPELYEECLQRNPDSGGRGGYFDTDCSPYHPENVVFPHYVYGTLPLFMARGAAELVVDWTGDPIWTSYNGIFHVWRALSALADTITIWLAFLIGLRLHNKWVGLVAAILYACAVFPIQQAHFGTADAITTMFVTLAIFFAVRAQDSGTLWDYAAFGLALGAAVASRINVAPLAVMIVVVALVRALPAFDPRVLWEERNRLITMGLMGVIVAGVASFVAFRLFQPYAFTGTSIFGILPDERYISTLSHARYTVSGELEMPPNWQWVNRTSYLFPFQNMVLWGMGIAFGLTAWAAWAFSGWRLIRGCRDGLRNIVLFLWIGGYFAWVGNLWVMSMRYYLPLYPVFAVLAAWLLLDLVARAWESRALIRRWLAGGLLALVVGFTVLWALMFTNIYRSMATFTQASHWVWENMPGDFYMEIEGADEDAPLLNIALSNAFLPNNTPVEDRLRQHATRILAGVPSSSQFTSLANGTVSSVHAPRLVGVTFERNPDNGLVDAIQYDQSTRTLSLTVTRNRDNVRIGTATLTSDFPQGDHPLGQAYSADFAEPFEVEQGETYTFAVEIISGESLLSGGTVLAAEIDWEEVMPAKVCRLPDNLTLADNPPSGLNTLDDCNSRDAWGSGLLTGMKMLIPSEDEEWKRQHLQTVLDQSDYIIIPTNRRYDSQRRIPSRWPLTNQYYEALFSGELGFELDTMFQETFELGPLKVSDQYLPIYDAPEWLNEFEAEEAFHVYDHPVVFIFRKTAAYSSENTANILNDVSLNRVQSGYFSYNDPQTAQVIVLPSLDADEMPSQLMMTPEVQEMQTTGGTWSDRFDADSLLSSNQIVAIAVWWLAIMAFGFVAWPILFVTFPALADRGYGMAKVAGILLIAWGTWFLSSLRIPVWSQTGILVGLFILAGISSVIVWRNRRRFLTYIRARWHLLLAIEALSFVLYLFFIGIRLTNPDLWHSAFGGEKPMDFAYFNAVLRSTVFPPLDPWFAGGYINYYYFGFVIVGAPTLLLGIIPALAYNLIIPTLFSLTGMAAFSAAYNIASGWRTSVSAQEQDEAEADVVAGEHAVETRRRPLGNPWLAGATALMLAVILGNLGTAQVILNGLARLGGYEQPASLQQYFQSQLTDAFVQQNNTAPDEQDSNLILSQSFDMAENISLSQRIEYFLLYPESLLRGISNLLSGDTLYIDPSRWFWGPTRVITEIPGQADGAINEMPFFTFLYADLHAHMIAMPMLLLAVVFVYNELMATGRDRRGLWAKAGALFLGALVIGMLQATNTWDFPTFMILAVLGLGYAWWLNWQRITRWSLISLFARVGGFIILALLVALPYTWWFASGLTAFKIWEGRKTPLWAYFTIHGVFLFIIVTLLIWETARWLRSVKVAALRGRLNLIYGALMLSGGVLLVALVLAIIGYPVALVVIPLVAWIAVLFFRPGQSRSMQFVLVLVGLALAITMGTEVITLANDNGRQNTIFKFYIQVWLLLSVAGGTAIAWFMRQAYLWRGWVAVPWFVLASILFFVAALYPLQATRGKAVFRLAQDVPTTLNGMDYMLYTSHVEDGAMAGFDMVDDHRVIRWLQENVQGSPVIMEAQSKGSLYKWGGRISIYTGLPSVVGWDYHQRQQRSLEPLPSLVMQREANVNAFYTTPDPTAAARILQVHNVEYVIVTSYEQARYGDTGGLQKLDAMVEQDMLALVYQEGNARIYRVNQDNLNIDPRTVFVEFGE